MSTGLCRAQLSGSVKARNQYTFQLHVADTDPFAWICEGDHFGLFQQKSTCADEVSKSLPHLKTWTTSHYCNSYVMYCLGEVVEEMCTLRFSLWVTLVVILCNMGKLGAMLLVLQTSSHLKPLITLGDAIESFLMKPDPNTEALCLVTRQNIGSQDIVVIEKNFGERGNLGLLARDWQCATRRWYQSATFGRWRISFLFTLLALGAVVGLLVGALYTTTGDTSLPSLWKLGFGSITGRTLLPVGQTNALYYNIFRANLPQTIFSLLYFAINSLVTSMLLGREWNAFAYTRKTLRVSSPEGDQRSTYTLQLPYKYSIALMAICGTLQWLLSQSFFLVWIDNIHPRQNVMTEMVTCGYSPISIICVFIVGVLLLLGLVSVGFRKFSNGIPFLPWSSVAISAACHPPPGEENSHLKPLQWGTVLGTNNNDPPLCSFSSGTVTMPVVHPTLEPTYSPLDLPKVPKNPGCLICEENKKYGLDFYSDSVLHGHVLPLALGINSGEKTVSPGRREARGLYRYRLVRGIAGLLRVDREDESKKTHRKQLERELKADKMIRRYVFKETLKAIKQCPPPVKYDERGMIESDPGESNTLSGSERRREEESN
ncbi:MAG: hypothetical protein M1824_001638 [Vezdaea acicularis]|nr:MAG: hypothetical protein M1824_001638 [Vezdaea acicularis]